MQKVWISAALLWMGCGMAVAADRQVALDPASWVSFEQREAMGRERAETEGGTAAMAAGVYYQPERSLRRYASVSEFALPQVDASGVRSATLQLVRSKSRCKGDGPVALQLRAYAGDGTASAEDAGAGAVVHTLQGDCEDAQAFSQPIDVTAAVKAQLAAGAKHIGFSLRPARDRVGIAEIFFYKPDRVIPENQRHRLILTLAGEGGTGPAATSAAPDVFGIRLGMTPDETRGALRARSKDLLIKEQRETLERLRGDAVFSMLNAELPERIPAGSLERFSVHFALPPAAPRAIYVARFGVFKPGQEPALADVKASLVKKYGEPSAVEERASDWSLVWTWAADGSQLVDKTFLQRCRRHGSVATNVLLADPDSRYLSKGCGVTLWAHMDRNQAPRAGAMGFGDLAGTFTLSLVDDTRFKDMRLAMKNQAAQTERQAAKPFDLDKAPEVAPKPAAPPVTAHTPWLEEMPAVDKVSAAIRGKDELDTAARQAGAFYQLREMIALLAGDRRYRNQLKDEEKRLMRVYAEADGAARAPVMARFDDAETQRLGMNSPRAKFVGAYTGYQFDKGLTDELIKRFFSPDFARIHQQAKTESDARTAAAKPTEQTICIPSPCPPGVTPKRAAAPPPEPEQPAKPDPAIAKAKAAGVDTKVFGVPLGEPLRLPACASLREHTKSMDGLGAFGAGLRGITTSTTCQSQGSMLGLIGGLLFDVAVMASDRYILLDKNSCPPWAYCEVVAFRHEGNLAGITIMVNPGAQEDQVGKQLRAKYGKPSRAETARYQNEFGARYEVDELEWNLPGLHVRYTPGPQGGGLVQVETETGRKLREARDAAREAKQPKL